MQIRKFIDRVNSLSMPTEHKNGLLTKIRKYLRKVHGDDCEIVSSRNEIGNANGSTSSSISMSKSKGNC